MIVGWILLGLALATDARDEPSCAASDGCLALSGGFQIPCAPLGKFCTRPCGSFLFHMRGTGAKMIKGPGLSVFAHLWPKANFRLVEAETLARASPSLASLRERGGVVVTILRHPIDRILSRYWFEGRAGMKPKGNEPGIPFEAWVQDHGPGSKGHSAQRLWNVWDSYYVRSFASAPLGALTRDDLAAARSGLSQMVVLVTEYLSAPASIAFLGSELCFRVDDRGAPPVLRDAKGENRSVPPFEKRAPFGGGGSALRPAGWAPSADATARLFAANALDLELYDGVAADFRARAGAAASFPPLMPMDAVAYRTALIKS